ncbi:MAG: hypothetical protein R3F29_04965 [Planctomycetota bacterium]
MNRPRYPTGDEIRAGDAIVFQGQGARVLFIKQVDGFSEFAPGVLAEDWDFMSDGTIFLEFEDGGCCGYDGFCDHDGITLVSRQKPPN